MTEEAPKSTTDGPRSTADEPWPVRVVSQKIGAWVARLGWVWVDGAETSLSEMQVIGKHASTEKGRKLGT